MNRAYPNKINWQNQPSTSTALGATNLNKMDNALYAIDERVVGMDTTKAEVTAINPLIKSVTYNNATGTLTFTHQNGTTTVIDTAMEKIVTNFSYNSAKQSIDLTLADGTTQSIDISAFVTNVDFATSNTIQFSVDANGNTKADVINGSITAEKLQTNYLADCQSAKTNAENSANSAKRYAVGGVVDGDTLDNAKYYKEQAEIAKNQAVAIAGLTIDPEPVKGSYNPIASKAVYSQIATAEGSFLNLANTLNGGLRVLVKGKLTEVGTGTKSPDNPYVLKGVGESGVVNVTACGKNLCNTMVQNGTVNGISWVVNQDKSITINGTATANTVIRVTSSIYNGTDNLLNLSNNTYTLSKNSNKVELYLVSYPALVQKFVLTKTELSKIVTTDCKDCYAYIFIKSGDTLTNENVKVQLELGTVATTYEPYNGKTAPIIFTTPIYDEDILEKRNGVWGIYRDKMKSVFDGSADENWIYVSKDTDIIEFRVTMDNSIASNGYIISNMFNSSSVPNTERIAKTQNMIYVRINKTRLTTQDVAGFKAWLSTNKIVAVYQLENPTWTPLTQAEQAQLNALCTFSGVTNVFCDDALNPTLSVQYGKTDVAALAIYDDNKTDTLNRGDYLYKGNIANNDAVTVEGFAYDARRGKALREDLTTLNESLSKLGNITFLDYVQTTLTSTEQNIVNTVTLPAGTYIINAYMFGSYVNNVVVRIVVGSKSYEYKNNSSISKCIVVTSDTQISVMATGTGTIYRDGRYGGVDIISLK